MRIMKFNKKWIIIIGFIAAFGFIGYGLFAGRGDSASQYGTAEVRRGNINQEVSVSGRVRPASSVDLAFEKSGKIAAVLVKVGDKVSAGRVLVSLDGSELAAQMRSARANILSARANLEQYEAAKEREQARLAEIQSGGSSEEISLAETRVANAKQSLEDARINLDQETNRVATDLVNSYEGIKDILRDAYARADDAITRQADQLFISSASGSPRLKFDTINPQTKTQAEWQRLLVGSELAKIKSLLSFQSLDLSSLEDASESARKSLLAIRDFLQSANDAVADAANLSASASESYRLSITTGLNNVNTVLSAANSQQQKIAVQKVAGQNIIAAAEAKVNDAKNVLAASQAELTLKRAPARAEEIAGQKAIIKQAGANLSGQRARVAEAEAQLSGIAAQMAQNSLVSPFNGLVTKQDAKVGEIVMPNSPAVSIIANAKFEVEASVPEVDIAKVKINNSADITLDAYGDAVVFKASVVSIEPAETMVEGVATYKAKLQFTEEDARIKSGMTANVVIFTNKRDNVLIIPQRAFIEQDGRQFVKILQNNGRKPEIKETAVTAGLRGSDGDMEIISGVSEGDKVVVSEAENK